MQYVREPAGFDRVGGFRVGVAEDKDWGQRAVAMGYQWRYAPSVRVSHPARRDWNELKRKWRRLTEEGYTLLSGTPFRTIYWLARAWLVLLSPFAHAVVVIKSPKLTRADAKAKAIVVLFLIRWWRFVECHRVLLSRIG
jgi:hypothetical protein